MKNNKTFHTSQQFLGALLISAAPGLVCAQTVERVMTAGVDSHAANVQPMNAQRAGNSGAPLPLGGNQSQELAARLAAMPWRSPIAIVPRSMIESLPPVDQFYPAGNHNDKGDSAPAAPRSLAAPFARAAEVDSSTHASLSWQSDASAPVSGLVQMNQSTQASQSAQPNQSTQANRSAQPNQSAAGNQSLLDIQTLKANQSVAGNQLQGSSSAEAKPSQSPNTSLQSDLLPSGEAVVPLPVVPADRAFEGFPGYEPPNEGLEELPSPNRPPLYKWPAWQPGTRSPATDGSEVRPADSLSWGGVDFDSLMAPGQGQLPFEHDEAIVQDGSNRFNRYPAAGRFRRNLLHSDSDNVVNGSHVIVPRWRAGFDPAGPVNHQAFGGLVNQPVAQDQIDALFDDRPPQMSNGVCLVPTFGSEFLETPINGVPSAPGQESATYYGKVCVPAQRPWVEWWRPFYGPGLYPPAIPVFTDVNPLMPQFLVYGDFRNGVGVHRDNGAPVRSWASRLNLDLDLKLTATERIHAFTGPLDRNGQFTRLDFSQNPIQFQDELEARFDTVFFEGDLGAMTGGVIGTDAPFDLPFTFGLVPLLYQNGIWMEDAIAGVAFGLPWRHSRPLNWANYDATFFAGFDQITSPAFNNDNGAATVIGTAWFIEAYGGYIEADYAYLADDRNLGRSYHNTGLAYTRRYFGRISNSIRFILNQGQSGPDGDRTADGGLLLLENSWITAAPQTIIPYANVFYGFGRPQSVARAVGSGGILRNTGINFETDGLTNYPTLDPTGSNAFGGAVGVNMLSADFTRQVAIEFAGLGTYGDPLISRAPGNQYGLGTRFQQALTNSTLIRADFMVGWLDHAPDIFGTRFEYRWKF